VRDILVNARRMRADGSRAAFIVLSMRPRQDSDVA